MPQGAILSCAGPGRCIVRPDARPAGVRRFYRRRSSSARRGHLLPRQDPLPATRPADFPRHATRSGYFHLSQTTVLCLLPRTMPSLLSDSLRDTTPVLPMGLLLPAPLPSASRRTADCRTGHRLCRSQPAKCRRGAPYRGFC